MIKFVNIGVEEFYEIGSGAVLSNLAKRIFPSFKRMSIGIKENVEDLLFKLEQ